MKPQNACSVAVAVAMAVAICSCASAPSPRYYELSVARRETASPARPKVELSVAQVVMPEALNRVEMVVQKTETESEVLDGHRWLSPLDDQLDRALFSDLQLALPTVWVTQRRALSGVEKRYTLRVAIQQMTLNRASGVVLAAAWTIAGEPDQHLYHGSAVIEVPVSAQGYDAFAPAISLAVQQLSARIANDFNGKLAERPLQ